MNWEFKPPAGLFEEIRAHWDALNRSRGNHLLLDSRFVAATLRHFGTSKVLLGIDKSCRAAGVGLFVKKVAGMWETFQPSQAPLGLILLETEDRAGERLRSIVEQLPGYALQLGVLQQDPDYSCFPADGKCLYETMDYIRTARLLIAGTFEDYWKGRGNNLRHNLARRRRRMSEQGIAAELLIYRDPVTVAECIREYGRLESTGWKGKNGTAVSENNAQGRFYREVFEAFCATEEAVIFQLRIGRTIAASDLCLCRDGMMIVLKTAYDEEFETFSPALLMREEIMKRIYAEQKVHTVEFYGKALDWHTKWTDAFRTMYHVKYSRHRWIPLARRLVQRFR